MSQFKGMTPDDIELEYYIGYKRTVNFIHMGSEQEEKWSDLQKKRRFGEASETTLSKDMINVPSTAEPHRELPSMGIEVEKKTTMRKSKRVKFSTQSSKADEGDGEEQSSSASQTTEVVT